MQTRFVRGPCAARDGCFSASRAWFGAGGAAGHRQRLLTTVRFKPQDEIQDYYSLLQVSPDSSPEEIKSQYRYLQKKCHPDISGDQEMSALLNEAYATLANPLRKEKYDRKLGQNFVRLKGELSWIPNKGPGVLGPVQPGDILATEVVEVEDTADFQKEGRKLLVWIREWAKTFVFASDYPLPAPVQCDDIDDGVRLAVIMKNYNLIQSAGELLITIRPSEKLDSWLVDARRVSVLRPGPIPGEGRLMQAFTDAMRDRSRKPGEKKGAFFQLSGIAAAAFAQLMPAVIPLPIGQPGGAAYEAYHLKHDEDKEEDLH